MMLKKRIDKHESRNPRPKMAGPNVPVENLPSVRQNSHPYVKMNLNGRPIHVERHPEVKDLDELGVCTLSLGYRLHA